jgi:hypothetical protein
MNRINNENDRRDKEVDRNICNLALVLLDQILNNKSTNPVEAIEGLLKNIRVPQNAKQKAKPFFGMGSLPIKNGLEKLLAILGIGRPAYRMEAA